ncbi:MAG: hypothetical protein HKL98_08300 [Burkholderiales bacterium]|nr:hypothetical protein [Burkholderiales bacterium]
MKLRRLLLLFAILSFLGIYSIAQTHYHADEAGELSCAVCHVAAHSAADIPVPDLSVPAFALVLLFLVGLFEPTRLAGSSICRPRSRSPPSCP